MELIVLLGAAVFIWWMANVSGDTDRAVRERVEAVTGSEDAGEAAGNGCGWLVFLVLFLIFAIAFPMAMLATFPEDCQTMAINRAMGRCP